MPQIRLHMTRQETAVMVPGSCNMRRFFFYFWHICWEHGVRSSHRYMNDLKNVIAKYYLVHFC